MTRNRAQTASASNPFAGQTLAGNYRIVELIGRGGMGLVYLAHNIATERSVVVKVLAPHWANDAVAVARFRREGERLSQLRHPNIVELHDLGHEGGDAFIVMEHIDGESLRHSLQRRGKLPLAVFVPIAQQILAAVGYAHARNIMLRDIKPSNIMLTERDDKADFIKMLDFGLAKLVQGENIDATRAHVVGTAGYLAPEQIRGDACDVRVDVYALGILFFVMLTGKSPIVGDSDGAVLYNHVHASPLELESLLPVGHRVPAGLIALIHRCLAKAPEHRPEDANEIADALFDCIPAELFALPPATAQTRRAIAEYRELRERRMASKNLDVDGHGDSQASSAQWTQPMLRELLQVGGHEAAGKLLADRRAPGSIRVRPTGSLSPPPPPPPSSSRPPAAHTPVHGRPGVSMPIPKRLRDQAPTPAGPAASFPGPSGPRPTIPTNPGQVTAPRPIIPVDIEPEFATGTTPTGSFVRPKPGAGLPIVEGDRDDSFAGDVSMPSIEWDDEPEDTPVDDGDGRHATLPNLGTALEDTASSPEVVRAVPVMFTKWPVALALLAVVALGGVLAYLTGGRSNQPAVVGSSVGPAEARAVRGADSSIAEGGAEPAQWRPAVPSTGVVTFDIPDEATLFIDGENRGRGLFSGELAIGRHFVRVLWDGYEPWEQDVTVLAGDNPLHYIDLDPVGDVEEVRPPIRRSRRARARSRRASPAAAAPTPAEAGTSASKPAPPPPPPPPPPETDDDVFMKRPAAKSEGVFLPVGKPK